jgi:hypothetical protein
MNYLLRNIPEGLWRRAKAAAALRGVTVRELLLSCLRDLAEGAHTASVRTSKKASRHLKHE